MALCSCARHSDRVSTAYRRPTRTGNMETNAPGNLARRSPYVVKRGFKLFLNDARALHLQYRMRKIYNFSHGTRGRAAIRIPRSDCDRSSDGVDRISRVACRSLCRGPRRAAEPEGHVRHRAMRSENFVVDIKPYTWLPGPISRLIVTAYRTTPIYITRN